MKALIRNIASISLLVTFVVFSAGLEINYHFCKTSKEKLVSLFSPAECHHEQEKVHACCHEGESHQVCDISQDSDDCCEDDVRIYKISDPFFFFNDDENKHLKLFPVELSFSIAGLEREFQTLETRFRYEHEIPPDICTSGREKLQLYNRLIL